MTCVVPCPNWVKVVSPEASSASSYLRKWASVAVPRICVRPVTVPPLAGCVMIAVGGTLSPGARAATLSVAWPERPPAVAVRVVAPGPAACATPAAFTVATAVAVEDHTTNAVMSSPVPSLLIEVALYGTFSPTTCSVDAGVTTIRLMLPRPGGGPGGGGGGGAGPFETTRSTELPRRACAPAPGICWTTWPAGAGLSICVTLPVANPAPVSVVPAAACVWPTTFGTAAGPALSCNWIVW